MQQVKNGTTIHLTLPDPRRLWHLPVPLTASIVVFCLIVIAALVGRIQQAPATAPAIAPTASLPVIVIQKEPAPAIAPVQQVIAQQPAAPAANTIRRAIVVYGAPDMASAIGAVEAGRAFTPIAWFGSEWMQLDVAGGTGLVYVRVADLYDLPANLIDLKPAPAPIVVERPAQPVYVSAPQAPVVEQPIYTTDSAPQQPAQPPEQPQQQPAPAVAPIAAPAPAQQPAQQGIQDTDATREWARQQWAAEHCFGGECH